MHDFRAIDFAVLAIQEVREIGAKTFRMIQEELRIAFRARVRSRFAFHAHRIAGQAFFLNLVKVLARWALDARLVFIERIRFAVAGRRELAVGRTIRAVVGRELATFALI